MMGCRVIVETRFTLVLSIADGTLEDGRNLGNECNELMR